METYGYGFNIPLGALINGIEVKYLCEASTNGSVKDSTVKLRRSATQLAGFNHFRNDPWSNNFEERTYGGPTDLWGETWTPADINSSEFGTFLKVYNQSNQARDASVDYVSITVTYSISTEVYSVTSSPFNWNVFQDASTGTVHVQLAAGISGKTASVELFDMTGRLVSGATSDGDAEIVLAADDLTPGIYTCLLISDGKSEARKILITQ
jgi:hypothetical protein